MSSLNLTFGRLFTLQQIAARETTSGSVAVAALDAGYNKRPHGAVEWADGFVRALARSGYIEETGEMMHRSKVYRITEKGRKALEEASRVAN